MNGVKNRETLLINNPLLAMSMNCNSSADSITIDPYARDAAGNLTRYARIKDGDVHRITAGS